MHFSRKLGIPTAAVAFALVAAACGSPHGYSAAGANDSGAMEATTSAPSTSVALANGKFGRMLVDHAGRTLYLFEADKGTTSTCYDSCAQAWPPLLTSGAPHAETGLVPSDLATTTRTDGKSQVTYHGHPLYYYVVDTKSGDVNGQDLNQFGAKWYVLDPNGNKIDNGS
jgi:predicted lipoprotein with Yx(FWY)xxD motif